MPKLLTAVLLVLLSFYIYPKTIPINSLTIKSANIFEKVYLGYSESILDVGLLLDRNSLNTNNWIIYGHRFSSSNPLRKYLRDLDRVKVGETIDLVFKGRSYSFVVDQVLIVQPSDLWVTAPTSESKLTIITCTPMINPKERLVVISKLVRVD